MSRIPVLFIFFFFITVFLSPPTTSLGQRSFGVLWDVPEKSDKAIHQLNQFKELKIKYIELNERISDQLWNEIQKKEFKVYVQIPVKFPVAETFTNPDSSLLQTYQQFLLEYGPKQIEAIGAFANGQTNNQLFVEAVTPFAKQLRNSLSTPIYYKGWDPEVGTIDSLFDFKFYKTDVSPDFQVTQDTAFSQAGAFIYSPSDELKSKMSPLKWFIQRTSVNPGAPLFFDAGWLLNFVDKYPSVKEVLTEFATRADAVFPLPEENIPTDNSHSVIVIVLILVWGTVALTYSFMPTYRRSLIRYFLSHKFFIEDVINRHIRTSTASSIILLQHAVLGGITFYCIASTYLSTTGVEVIHNYFPIITILGTGYFSFFFIGFIGTLLFQLASIVWLYTANRRIKFISQIVILYSWPLHLNFITTTIIVTLLLAGQGGYLMGAFLSIFAIFLLADFLITAFDTGEKINEHKWLYAVGTLGTYTLFITLVLLYLLTNTFLLNILQLATTIS